MAGTDEEAGSAAVSVTITDLSCLPDTAASATWRCGPLSGESKAIIRKSLGMWYIKGCGGGGGGGV